MAKKKKRKARPGDIYVVTNDCYVKRPSKFSSRMVPPIKIGRGKDFISRVGNLSSSVFEDFKYHAVLHVKDTYSFENQMHLLFADHRIYTKDNGKTEFFALPVEETLKRIKSYVAAHKEEVVHEDYVGVKGVPLGRSASSQKNKLREKTKGKGALRVRAAISKAKPSTFKVKFPDGTIIKSPLASEVFVNALVQFKLKRVAGLGFKGLIGRSEADFGSQTKELKQVGQWLINTHSSTGAKIQKIKSIAKKLDMKVKVTKA